MILKIIVEGCYGSGVTTFAKELADAMGLRYLHISEFVDCDDAYLRNIMSSDDIVVDTFLLDLHYRDKLSAKDLHAYLHTAKTNGFNFIFMGDSLSDCFAQTSKSVTFSEVAVRFLNYYRAENMQYLHDIFEDNMFTCNMTNKDEVFSELLQQFRFERNTRNE